jgi:hypothetical protein
MAAFSLLSLMTKKGGCHKGGRRFSLTELKTSKVCPDAPEVQTSHPVLGLVINRPIFLIIA